MPVVPNYITVNSGHKIIMFPKLEPLSPEKLQPPPKARKDLLRYDKPLIIIKAQNQRTIQIPLHFVNNNNNDEGFAVPQKELFELANLPAEEQKVSLLIKFFSSNNINLIHKLGKTSAGSS
jgi:hypothetical protein